MKRYSIVRYASVPLIISLVILYLCCFIPLRYIPDVEFDIFIPTDKIDHFLMYLGLSGATALNYIHGKRGYISISKLLLYAFVCPILYGGLIEVLQQNFFPPRTGDWFDFLANTLGSLVALPIAFKYRSYLLNK